MFLGRNTFPAETAIRVDASHTANGKAPARPRGIRYVWYKNVAEPSLALILLVLAVPVISAAALLVKLTSRGPIFYSQRRVGVHGQGYTLYKIRTMFHDCERLTGPRWATLQDPRITPVGRWLRRFHIDKLPQLWNVLRGQMSLVGPRPERPEIAAHLERMLPSYPKRHALRPGMTGLAQVQLPADRDLASVRTKLAHDLYYVSHLGLSLDVRILVCTAWHLLGIPFALSNRVLKLPGGEHVEQLYERANGTNGRVDGKMQRNLTERA